MAAFGKFILVCISCFISMLLNAYTIICLWTWFIVPTFELKSLNMIQALGLALIIGYLTYQPNDVFKEQKGSERFISMITYTTFNSLGFLTLGYIYHLFM